MTALLTAMSIMAIALAAALPAWQQMMQREQEEELVFRGEQYSHAIALFQRNRLRRGAGRGSGQRGASGPAEGRHTAAPDGRETGR